MNYSTNSTIAFLFVILLNSFSCTNNKNDSVHHLSSFFDLKSFFAEELKNIDQISKVQKTVIINGYKEVMDISGENLEDEISVFSKSDINRIAWLDKYDVDSIFIETGSLRFLRHRALDKNMRTQLLEVCYSGNKVTSIFIRNNINGFATNSKNEITYSPGYGYNILTEQKTLFGAKQEFKVDVRYNF